MEAKDEMRKLISSQSDEELVRIYEELPAEYSKEQIDLVGEELRKRGYKVVDKKEPLALSQLPSRLRHLLARKNILIGIASVVLLFGVFKLTQYVYFEIKGERDIVERYPNESVSEEYHMAKMEGEWTKNGSYQAFDRNGIKREEGSFKQGKRDGHWHIFSDKGHEEGDFKDDKEDGWWSGYYANGRPRYSTFYVRGVQEGKCEGYFEDGKLSTRGMYADGEKDGRWVVYYHDGSPRTSEVYAHGKKHGPFVSYLANHIPGDTGQYRDGAKDGEWISRNSRGVITRREEYEAGVLHHQRLYRDNGTPEYSVELDSSGGVIAEKFFDESGRDMIYKIVGTFKKTTQDMHSTGFILHDYTLFEIFPSHRYLEQDYSYLESRGSKDERVTSTRGTVTVTHDSVILLPRERRCYPCRFYHPFLEDRFWVDCSDKAWTPCSYCTRESYYLDDYLKEYHRMQ